MDSQALAGLGGLLVIFLMVLAVLWFFLPFAVFGIKDLLQQLINETKKNNELLSKLQKPELTTTNTSANADEKQYDVILGG